MTFSLPGLPARAAQYATALAHVYNRNVAWQGLREPRRCLRWNRPFAVALAERKNGAQGAHTSFNQ
jgi:hypothetical protein